MNLSERPSYTWEPPGDVPEQVFFDETPTERLQWFAECHPDEQMRAYAQAELDSRMHASEVDG